MTISQNRLSPLQKDKMDNKSTTSWARRLRSSFLPVIRERGERYARERRVDVKEVSASKIQAKVKGTVTYNVELFVNEDQRSQNDGKNQGITTFCDCPFFRQGFPCKHLWAAIVEADRKIYREKKEATGIGRNQTTGRIVAKVDRNWRTFFNQQPFARAENADRTSSSTGNFVPVYELSVGESSITLSAVEKYLKKDGTLGRKRKITYSSSLRASVPAADRILLALAGDISRTNARFSYYSSNSPNYEEILLNQKEDLEVILPLLADSERCTVTHWRKGVIADPLRKGHPFQAGFRLQAEEAQDGKIRMVPVFCLPVENGDNRDERLLEVAGDKIGCIFNTDPVLFIAEGRLYQAADVPFRLINRIYPLKYLEVPEKEIRDFVKESEKIPEAPALELPHDIAPGTVEHVEPRGVLIMEFESDQAVARLVIDYDGLEIEWQDRRKSILDPDRWIRIERDLSSERHLVKTLEDAGFVQEADRFARPVKNIASALKSLQDQGIRIEASNRKKIHTTASKGFRISSGLDWFDLEGEISFGDDIVPLPRAIKEFMRGNYSVELDDGSIGLLPSEWMEQNAAIFDLALSDQGGAGTDRVGKNSIRFPSSRALLIDALLAEADEVRTDAVYKELKEQLQNFQGIESHPVPPQFKGKLRKYQKDALGWFAFLERFNFGGILADDMGLGKTVQVLAWLSRLISEDGSHIKPSLIVVPTSLVFNWKSEAERFVPEMKVLLYGGTEREGLFSKIPEHHIVITTYGLMRRDIEKLREVEFEYVILDESQAIKNPVSLTAKAARLLRARHKLCLTGTPLENNVGELWSQMEFLNPGMLGSRTAFERNFLKPIEKQDKKALDTLKTIVRPFILRRTKEVVASDLPEKMEQTVLCVMPAEQQELYSKLRDHYRTSILSSVQQNGMGRSKIKVLEALLRLRQAANHPALVGHPDCPSGKFTELLSLVEEAVSGGHKALVFSQFTRMLSLITTHLQQQGIPYEYLDGSVPQKKRQERVTNFQENHDIKLFLISLKAGGVGLNLTAADYVFIVDPWWNPAAELQAVDRTHRIGQDKRVFTYRFITKDTVEEKVLALQKQKRELVSSILSGSGDMLKNLSADDLEVLFS